MFFLCNCTEAVTQYDFADVKIVAVLHVTLVHDELQFSIIIYVYSIRCIIVFLACYTYHRKKRHFMHINVGQQS